VTATLALAAALAAPPVPASVARAVPLPEMVDRADVIAVAVARSSRSFWEDGRIVTDSILAVDTPVLGSTSGGRLVVRTLGGEVGGLGQRVFGEPWFAPGDRCLVFLERDGAGRLRPIGMAQGVLPIVRAAGGPQVVPNPDLPAVDDAGLSASVAPWLVAPRPLAEVLADVRALVEERGR
jgi:hypothetical protein